MVAPSLSAVAQTQLLVVLSETQRCVSYRMAVNKERYRLRITLTARKKAGENSNVMFLLAHFVLYL